jgi:hypothetical protein
LVHMVVTCSSATHLTINIDRCLEKLFYENLQINVRVKSP